MLAMINWSLNLRCCFGGAAMPVGLVRKDYLLNEAFELIGQRLYGDAWTAQELFARKIVSPDEMMAERAPFEAAIDTAQRLIGRLRKEQGRVTDTRRLVEIEAEIKDASERRSDAYFQLQHLPDPTDDSYISDHGTFLRRNNAEQTLITALGRGDIEVWLLGGSGVPKEFWHGQNGFAYDLMLSVVWMPRQRSGLRRGSARIRETQFDDWLRSVLPDDAADRADISPEDRCRAFLIEAGRSGPKAKPRDAYKKEAMAAIPGLSERAFLQAWAEIAPPHWKRRGRPASKN